MYSSVSTVSPLTDLLELFTSLYCSNVWSSFNPPLVLVDVGYWWAADSPRWVLWGGEEVWLCVAAADGWSHGWVCVSDWDRPLRPAQSLPAGQSGTVMISSLRSASFMCHWSCVNVLCLSLLFWQRAFEIKLWLFDTKCASLTPTGSRLQWFQRERAERFSVHGQWRRTAVIVEGQRDQCS